MRKSFEVNVDWNTYCHEVLNELHNDKQKTYGYFDVLNAAKQKIPIPWTIKHFRDIENRRLIGGIMPKYGWLGHVSASGKFRQLLANNNKARQQAIIVNEINAIAQMNLPISWVDMKLHLNKLRDLGPTMRVWGRLLCITRPDLYCTIASPSVRINIYHLLGISESKLIEPDGYIEMTKKIHSTRWFNSPEPKDKNELAIWERRAAFLDAIIYTA